MLSKKMEALSGKTDSLSTRTTALENDAGVEYVIEFEDISDKKGNSPIITKQPAPKNQ